MIIPQFLIDEIAFLLVESEKETVPKMLKFYQTIGRQPDPSIILRILPKYVEWKNLEHTVSEWCPSCKDNPIDYKWINTCIHTDYYCEVCTDSRMSKYGCRYCDQIYCKDCVKKWSKCWDCGKRNKCCNKCLEGGDDYYDGFYCRFCGLNRCKACFKKKKDDIVECTESVHKSCRNCFYEGKMDVYQCSFKNCDYKCCKLCLFDDDDDPDMYLCPECGN